MLCTKCSALQNSQYKLRLVGIYERRNYLHSVINYSKVQSIVAIGGLPSQRIRILTWDIQTSGMFGPCILPTRLPDVEPAHSQGELDAINVHHGYRARGEVNIEWTGNESRMIDEI